MHGKMGTITMFVSVPIATVRVCVCVGGGGAVMFGPALL